MSRCIFWTMNSAGSRHAGHGGRLPGVRRAFRAPERRVLRRNRLRPAAALKPGHFSFNTREGQCPTCCGLGHIDLDVQYLPDITVGCPTCHGARFSDATLAVQVDGLTIADVLGLSVREALERFDIPAADGSVAPVAARRKAGIPASQA